MAVITETQNYILWSCLIKISVSFAHEQHRLDSLQTSRKSKRWNIDKTIVDKQEVINSFLVVVSQSNEHFFEDFTKNNVTLWHFRSTCLFHVYSLWINLTHNCKLTEGLRYFWRQWILNLLDADIKLWKCKHLQSSQTSNNFVLQIRRSWWRIKLLTYHKGGILYDNVISQCKSGLFY